MYTTTQDYISIEETNFTFISSNSGMLYAILIHQHRATKSETIFTTTYVLPTYLCVMMDSTMIFWVGGAYKYLA